jgi:hypothetical protein
MQVHFIHPILIRTETILILVCLLTALSGCGPRPETEKKSPAVQDVQILEVEDPEPHHQFHTVAMEMAETSMTLKLRWDVSWPVPQGNTILGLCLPAGRKPAVNIRHAELAGDPVRVYSKRERPSKQEELISHLNDWAGTIEYMGMLRYWPIYRLEFGRQVWGPLRKYQRDQPADQQSGHYDITLQFTWKHPFEVAVTPYEEPCGNHEADWMLIASRVVCNPGAIPLCRVEDPEVVEYTSFLEGYPAKLSDRALTWARVDNRSDGLVRLKLDELLKLNFAADKLKPENIRIFSRGDPVPLIHVLQDRKFSGLDPGIYFRALPGDGIYSRDRTYWITADHLLPGHQVLHQSPLKLSPEPASLTSFMREIEINRDHEFRIRHGSFLAIEEMGWVDSELIEGRPVEIPFHLPHLFFEDELSTRPERRNSRQGPEDQVEVELDFFLDKLISLNRKSIQVMIGGQDVQEIKMYGSTDRYKKFSFPRSLVNDEVTTLSLLLKSQLFSGNDQEHESGIWLDKIRFRYRSAPRLLNGSISIMPDMVDGAEFWLPLEEDEVATSSMLAMRISDSGRILGLPPFRINSAGQDGIHWKVRSGEHLEIIDTGTVADIARPATVRFDDLTSQTEPVDYLIITHGQFWRSAGRLVEFHRSRGLSVRLVNIQDVYDSFSHGELSPEAIRRFLAYTLKHWKQGAPSHVLLLGDCNSDYLDLVGQDVRNWIPTYTYNHGLEKWASDYWMTTVTPEDDLPDFSLGRISITSREDASAIVDKLIAYAEDSRPGPWRSRLAYISDDGEFPSVVDALRRDHTPWAFGAERVFLNELPYEDNWLLDPGYVEDHGMKVSGAATRAILDTFKRGVSYMTYFGHGSPNIWADERIWFGGDSVNSDNQHLADSGFMTFVANMTCNSGAIDYPQPPWNICITEDMMRVPNGGAIACFVPSGPGTTVAHRRMSIQLHQVLFEDRIRELGLVIVLAKTRFALQKQHGDLLYMFHLLGDPATHLQMTMNHGQIRFREQALSPGTESRLRIRGLNPDRGKWRGELVDRQANVIWKSPDLPYLEGEVGFRLALPQEIDTGIHHLRIFTWDPDTGEDHAISGIIDVQYPSLRAGPMKMQHQDGSEPSRVALNMPIRNHGKVFGVAALHLNVLCDGKNVEKVDQRISLRADASENWTREIQLPDKCKNIRVVGTLTQNQVPDDPAFPVSQGIEFESPVRPGSSVVLQRPCILEYDLAGSRGKIHVAGRSIYQGLELIAGIDSHDGDTITTTTLKPGTGEGDGCQFGLFEFSRGKIESLTSSTLWLKAVLTDHPTSATIAQVSPDDGYSDRLPVHEILQRRPSLQIVSGSISVSPANPSEGQTVYIDCEVKNTGDAMAARAVIALVGHKKNGKEEMLPNRVGKNPLVLPDMAPGRTTPVRLRWDPLNNAGPQKIKIQLMDRASGVRSKLPGGEHVIDLEVKTPPDLSVVRTWVDELTSKTLEQKHQIIRTGHLTFHSEIRNAGQTGMPRVIVEFYRSSVQIPENLLGSVELASVPGEGAAVADFSWNFNPDTEFGKGIKPPTPSVKAYRKGSTHRITGMPRDDY